MNGANTEATVFTIPFLFLTEDERTYLGDTFSGIVVSPLSPLVVISEARYCRLDHR